MVKFQLTPTHLFKYYKFRAYIITLIVGNYNI